MTKEEYKLLKDIAYEVIIEEQLSVPTEIKFKNPLNGANRRMGANIWNKLYNTYKISVTTTEAQFVEDDNGTLINKQGKKYKKLLGKERNFNDIKLTLAHEIAHIKYRKHNKEHKNYTQQIIKLINNKLEA